jgi:hypothetical protein
MNGPLILYLNNSQVLTVSGLSDSTGSLISNATLTASVTDPNGSPVPGLQNIALTAVSGAPGSYQAQLPQSMITALGPGYTTTVQGAAGASSISVSIPTTVTRRTQ